MTGGEAGAAPDRGPLVWLMFNPQAGHAQAGRRPALVLAAQVKSLDRRTRAAEIAGGAPAGMTAEVLDKLGARLLGFER